MPKSDLQELRCNKTTPRGLWQAERRVCHCHRSGDRAGCSDSVKAAILGSDHSARYIFLNFSLHMILLLIEEFQQTSTGVTTVNMFSALWQPW